MNLDEFIKYLIWVIFFGVALLGLWALLKKFGIM
jgi:hypothetical protein